MMESKPELYIPGNEWVDKYLADPSKCPFCGALEPVEKAPIDRPFGATGTLAVPKRCLRCGAEYRVLHKVSGLVVTLPGREVEPRKPRLYVFPQPRTGREVQYEPPVKAVPVTNHA